ncbi:MAG: SdrD B-like domain-containing protein, partial [Nitrososphaeria archaeon]
VYNETWSEASSDEVVFSVSGPFYQTPHQIKEIYYIWEVSFSQPAVGKTYYLYWEAHLAIGSSNWPGAKLHTRTNATGNQDVPIMAPPSPAGADLAIEKSGPRYAHVGETITYMYTVTNAGPASAIDVEVNDDKAGQATYVSGDTNNNEKLDVGETWTFTATYKISETDPDPLKNIATVTSATKDPNLSNNQASWSVDILNPDIMVEKSGPDYAHEGDTITYTITVKNTGDCPLYTVSVFDDVLGDLTGYLLDTTLEVGEMNIFDVDYTVKAGDPDPLENKVTASGKDALEKPVSDSDVWTVDVLHPAIEVTKSADKEKAYAEDVITYTITITNTGDCTLYNVVVEDEFLGLDEKIDELAAGESVSFEIEYTVKVGDPDPLVNTVTASGKDVLEKEVTAEASAEVDLIAKICGFKFHDKNANGKWDEDEESVEGWTIELWLGDTKIGETTTGSDGSYCFDELDAGTYSVKEVLQEGWRNTTPDTITVELQSGQISEGNNFGNIKLGSISGYKFYDKNTNGAWDGEEVAIEGWKVHLTGTNILGEPVDLYAFTDENGKFIFKDLLPGTYTVEEVFPPPELNGGCMWISTTESSFTHELEAGEDYVGPAFGNICLEPGYGGKTIGFWSNKNGQGLITSSDVAALNELKLYKPTGWTYPPFSEIDLATAKAQIKNYLLSATAKDMRWMLSAQLIATKLNTLHGFLDPNTIVYINGKSISIGTIMDNANSALTGTDRIAQEYWKNLLDGVNNNRFYFICEGPCYPINYG